jgi:hypothetical protein
LQNPWFGKFWKWTKYALCFFFHFLLPLLKLNQFCFHFFFSPWNWMYVYAHKVLMFEGQIIIDRKNNIFVLFYSLYILAGGK